MDRTGRQARLSGYGLDWPENLEQDGAAVMLSGDTRRVEWRSLVEIHVALISAPIRNDISIFGRPLPERTILICQRAGIKQFVLEVPQQVQGEIVGSLSRFSHYGSIAIVESLSTFFAGHAQSEICTPGLLISGNLVFSKLHVAAVARMYSTSGVLSRILSGHGERSGQLAVGTIAELLTCASDLSAADLPGDGTSLLSSFRRECSSRRSSARRVLAGALNPLGDKGKRCTAGPMGRSTAVLAVELLSSSYSSEA